VIPLCWLPMPNVLVPIADGSEEIETTGIQDTLVRAGCTVTLASVMPDKKTTCKMSRGLNILADKTIDECVDETWDAIVLPGGMPGAEHLRDSAPLADMLKKQKAGGSGIYAAICASPAVVFTAHDLLPASGATCYPAPAFKEKVPGRSDARVVVDGKCVTSQGPGTAIEFGLKLAELLVSKEKADEVAKAMLMP
jgi:4-methyl-5(b-hydroxyethyl)-thiazole monophosphate biosynthesis